MEISWVLVFDIFHNLVGDPVVLEFVSSLALDSAMSGLPSDEMTLKFIVNTICHEKFSKGTLKTE